MNGGLLGFGFGFGVGVWDLRVGGWVSACLGRLGDAVALCVTGVSSGGLLGFGVGVGVVGFGLYTYHERNNAPNASWMAGQTAIHVYTLPYICIQNKQTNNRLNAPAS